MTKDEIINKMIDEMPFIFVEGTRPYIKEAMEIYAQEQLKNRDSKSTIEQRKEKFTDELNKFSEQYPYQMLMDFYEYWTEHGINDRKMRFEKEKSFGLSRRLATWHRNQLKYEANRKNNSNRFESDTTRRTIENFRQRVEQKG